MAVSMAQMGQLLFQQDQFENALKLLFKSYQIFKKLESPYVKFNEKDIARIRKKMSKDQFENILKELNPKPNF